MKWFDNLRQFLRFDLSLGRANYRENYRPGKFVVGKREMTKEQIYEAIRALDGKAARNRDNV